MKQFIATSNDAGTRLSRFVLRLTLGLPQAALYKSFRKHRIKVNGRPAAPEYRLAEGDIVQLYLNDEYFPEKAEVPYPARPSAASSAPITALYEDAGIAILFKAAGTLAHSDTSGQPGLLESYIAQLAERGEYDPAKENTFAPALCNRLDRGTEGLLIAAKQAPALRDMNALIRAGQLQKNYLGVCHGAPPQGLHSAWLLRDKGSQCVTVLDAPAPGARAIRTRVQVLQTAGELSLCQISLETGRTHQIRAHLAHLGTPLLGDTKYGDPASNRRYGVRSQMLCAWQLVFPAAMPSGSALAALSSQSFTATPARLPRQWEQLAKVPQ